MRKHFLLFGLFSPIFFYAQSNSAEIDTSYNTNEIVVTGFKPDSPKLTSLNIEPYSLALMNEKNPFNLSDALAKLPGVSQMTTGNAISKPIIRGLYGNRILVLLSGVRFDNQQWQDEHGLGLSQIGIDRVEVIKGPASLLYGSDALGGVINIVETKPNTLGKKWDIGNQFFSNSLGNLTDFGFSQKTAKSWYRLRVGMESHSDYSDGKGHRVLNSRNDGYYFKAGFGFERPKWLQENSYNFSYNQYGFILEDLTSFFAPDARWSRSMAGPHHNVLLNLFNSQNTFFLPHSRLKLNAGFQSNLRMEDEGGGQISLNMHLLSGLENLRWEKDVKPNITFVCNQQFTFTNNTNYGGRIIIPDANLVEGNVSGYFKFFLHKFILEAGAGTNYKYIKTFQTSYLNAPGETMQPFSRQKITGNLMAGFAYNPFSWLTFKSNSATGFRAPNLAELSANGLHEGVYRYEIGDPNLKLEQNLNVDITGECTRKHWFLSASGYYNHFFNYVYLAPTTEKFYGFPVFRYRQQNATLRGGEFFATFKPIKEIQWKNGFTLTRGTLANGSNLPFIPAYKFTSAIRFEKSISHKINNLYIEPEFIYILAQQKPAQFETNTPAYFLINFSSGITIPTQKGDWKMGISATNLTNKAYYDHLSRLKYYGLYNQGRNIVFSLRKNF
jgi:iron complex outermembrane receptor protein